MMAYYKKWRKCHAEVRHLAESSSSSSSDEQEDREVQEMGIQSSENTEEVSGPSTPDNDISHDTNSEYGLTEGAMSTSDSGTEDVDADNKPDVAEELASWATRNKCTRSGLNEMLDIFRRQGYRLPKDARTLLQTPQRVESVDKCGGQYTYFGIETGLLRILAHPPFFSSENNSIDLFVSVDGLPLFKSSLVQFWPILCSFHNFEPFIVALYCGHAKPNCVREYFSDVLHEFQQLKQSGITHKSNTYQLNIKGFICDALARAFLKCTKSHNAYFACERCTIKGSWNGRVVLHAEEVFPLRTEDDFNSVSYKDHQIAKSPLIDVGISLKHFSLDYMHLVCLGVVKRILFYLKKGPRNCKLSQKQWSEVSDNLVSLNGKMPREFSRQPRALYELERWKATEYRQFVLYTGPVHGFEKCGF